MINESAVIWITDKIGVVPEEYQGKWSLKTVQKYQFQGQEKVSYDWVHREKWNPDTRKREMPAKANAAMGVYLGSKEQAVKALDAMLGLITGYGSGEGLGKDGQDGSGVPF